MAEGTLTVGNVDILAINDSDSSLPLSEIFPDVPPDAWAPYQRRYPQSFISREEMVVHFDCYLIRSQGQWILVDTGLGGMISSPNAVSGVGGGLDGRLLSELVNLGVSPEDVGFFLDGEPWKNLERGAMDRAVYCAPGGRVPAFPAAPCQKDI